MYKITLSRQALEDLRRIYEYYAFTLGLSDVAIKQISSLRVGISKLNHFYKKYHLKNKNGYDVRMMIMNDYSIIYIPDSINKIVTILRIFHGTQDTEEALKNQLSNY